MKHSRIAQRVLSLVLTGALLLPSLTGITPAMAAASGEITAQLGSTPISLNFTAESDGKWIPNEDPTQRLWLNVDDNTAVVDDFSYTVTSDKGTASERYQVDEYGYLTLKAGKLPIEGEILTVTASVDYFDGDVVLFADNVVNGTDKEFTTKTDGAEPTENYNYGISDTSMVANKATEKPAQVARTGEYGITSISGVRNTTPIHDLSGSKVVLTAWYYDPVEEGVASLSASSDTQMGVNINAGGAVNKPNKYAMGISAISGNASANDKYYYRTSTASGNGTWTAGSARAEGWHKMQWLISDSGIEMKFDGNTLHTDSSSTTLSQICLTTNKGSNTDGSDVAATKAVIENRHFLDDISVVKSGVTPTPGTVSIQIPVNYTAPKAPVITTQPTNQRVAVGETVTLTVEATDPANGTLTYAWFKADMSDAVGTAIDAATTATLTLSGATTAATGYYYCNVTNTNGTTKSAVVKVTVLAESSRPATPAAPSIDEDGSVTFAYSGQGDISFKMSIYRSGENIPATTATKVITLNNSNWANTNLLTELRALGEGSYTVTATRLGGTDALDSLESDASRPVVLSKLSVPTGLSWTGATLSWNAVDDANGYSIQLYKDGQASGNVVTVAKGITSALMSISRAMPDGISATVTAVADPTTLYFDSMPSDHAQMNEELRLTVDGGSLHKGELGRAIIEGPANKGGVDKIVSFVSSDPGRLAVNEYGDLSIPAGYSPTADEEPITITATVNYYPDTVWANNFEAKGGWPTYESNIIFTGKSLLADGQAAHSGRFAGTPNSSIKDSAESGAINKTGTLVFWYYDPFTAEEQALTTSDSQAKYGMMINGFQNFFAGVAIPTTGEATAGGFSREIYRDHYGYRESGTWKATTIKRSAGWHRFEINVSANGATYSIDGTPACVHGTNTPILNTNVKTIEKVLLTTNWGNQALNGSYVNSKHFIDDIYVIANNLQPESKTLTANVTILPKNYKITSDTVEYDLNYPEKDIIYTITPDLIDLASVKLGEKILVNETDYTVVGNVITIKKEFLAKQAAGSPSLVLTMTDGITVTDTLKLVQPVSRKYYVSNKSGNDSNDGLTPETAWKTLSKLNNTIFYYGDQIFLDAQSTWNEQLVLRGDGREGRPITLTRYNNDATHPRPVINGMGTNGTRPSYIVEGNSSGTIKLSGAVELWNSGYWEISWLEVTNLGEKPGNGRSGIMIMNDYCPNSYSERTQANWWASRKDHIYITDSYVHDVNGLHQAQGGTKHAGGITGYGYLSDFKVERCRVSKADNEGIRNTIFNPGGTNSSVGYPADAATYLTFRNNFIDKVSGDAMVQAGGNYSVMEYNVATTLGKSYVTDTNGNNLAPDADPVLLGTQNYAAMWVMGCKNSVAQYNEVYDTQYSCPDGEAWDIDLYSENYVYQYNYSHRNSGGCVLFMGGSKNNIFRYNLSLEDGGISGRNHLVYYAASGSSGQTAYPLIYNNVFSLGENVNYLIDGNNDASKYLHFQNNILYTHYSTRPKLLYKDSDVVAGGAFTNNIIWPADLYGENITKFLGSGMTVSGNQTVDPALVNDAKENRPTLSADWVSTWDNSYLTSDNWFDAKVNELLGGYKLQADSPAINKGVRVPYWDSIPVEDRFPLIRDFFGTPIDESDPNWTPDIGIHEYTPPVSVGSFRVTFLSNGGTVPANPGFMDVVDGQTVVTLPTAPTRSGHAFEGWNTKADGTGTIFTAATVVTEDITVYAQWKSLHYNYTVTFDKNGGDTDASPVSKTITDPATSLGSLPTAPTRAGYDFAGWNTEADGTGSVFTAKSTVSGNMKVYAQWKPVGSFTVTYDKNGGDTEANPGFQIVIPPASNVGTLPAAPSRSGYTFTGWNTTKTGSGTAFTGGTEVSGNITVYAQWQVYTPSPSNPTPKPKPEEKPAENVTATEGGDVTVKENKDGSSTYTFKPEKEKEVLYVRVNGLLVKADSYTAAKGEEPSIVVVFGESGTDHTKDYTDTAALPDYMTEAVNYVVDSGLFQGNGNSFMPMDNMNRAMFATVLARLYGADTAALTSDFADVAQDAWYAGGVAWISQMGITSGVGGNHFAPEADMTRQELVTLVYRFAQKVGADVSASGDLTTFPDGDSVDTWSADAMRWAVGLGMINGKSGALAPNDTISRVEAAIILQRMADLLVKA